MGKIHGASCLMALGLILVAISILLPLFPPSSMTGTWTKEQALEHSKTSADLHRLAHERGHAREAPANHQAENDSALEREFAEAEARYKQEDAQLRQAQNSPDRMVFWIRYFGAGMLAVGVAAFFYLRRQQAKGS